MKLCYSIISPLKIVLKTFPRTFSPSRGVFLPLEENVFEFITHSKSGSKIVISAFVFNFKEPRSGRLINFAGLDVSFSTIFLRGTFLKWYKLNMDAKAVSKLLIPFAASSNVQFLSVFV